MAELTTQHAAGHLRQSSAYRMRLNKAFTKDFGTALTLIAAQAPLPNSLRTVGRVSVKRSSARAALSAAACPGDHRLVTTGETPCRGRG